MGWLDRFRKKPPVPKALISNPTESVALPFVRIELGGKDVPLAATASKIGGVPYVPVGTDPPVARVPYRIVGEGPATTQLSFIAQIDFADVDLEPFPRSGLLQLWIAVDDLLGFRNPAGPDEYRVIYHADTMPPARTDLPAPLDAGPLSPSALAHGRAMIFTRETSTLGDDNSGHRLGGYCAFTQQDPRRADDPQLSLLQLDSDDAVFWGDTGIAHWFIREAELRARDFSKVQYYWDCC